MNKTVDSRLMGVQGVQIMAFVGWCHRIVPNMGLNALTIFGTKKNVRPHKISNNK